jgi:hypothetical protein
MTADIIVFPEQTDEEWAAITDDQWWGDPDRPNADVVPLRPESGPHRVPAGGGHAC